MIPFFLRFLTLSLLSLLLLSPFISWNILKTIKPKLLILADNSESLKNYKNFNNSSYISTIENLKSKLSEKYSVVVNTFSNKSYLSDTIDLKGTSTDISLSLLQSVDYYSNDNLSSVILMTDGVYNMGTNPSYISSFNNIDINTVLYGDTSRIKDAKINSVDFNPLLFFDEESFSTVNVGFDNMQGQMIKTHLYEFVNGKKIMLESKSSTISSTSYNESLSFKLRPKSKGIIHYQVEIECSNGEINCNNNVKDIYVEVVDGRKNVLMLANAPHPDITAIKSALESNKSFSFSYKLIDNFSALPDNIDLLILYQLPSKIKNIDEIIKQANNKGTAILYMLGSQSNYNSLNTLQNSLKINSISNSVQDYTAVLNPSFTNFVLTDNAKVKLKFLPPLDNTLIETTVLKDIQPFMFQKIGNVETNRPLVLFSNTEYQSIGFVLAENLWRWRLLDFKYNNSNEIFNELISKIVNYLAIKKNKKQLVLQMSKNIFISNEPIDLKAQVYNKAFQPVSNAKVTLNITSHNGFNKNVDLLSNGISYATNLGSLPFGDYHATIETVVNGEKFVDKKQFSVSEFQLEKGYARANYEDLNSFAVKNNGSLYFPNHINSLVDSLLKKEYKNKIIEYPQNVLPIDLIYVLLLILLLISIEWILRKYFGNY